MNAPPVPETLSTDQVFPRILADILMLRSLRSAASTSLLGSLCEQLRSRIPDLHERQTPGRKDLELAGAHALVAQVGRILDAESTLPHRHTRAHQRAHHAVAEGVGPQSHDAIVIIRDVAYFLGGDGVYIWGPEGLTNISRDTVNPWFASDTYFNRSKYSIAWAYWNQLLDSYR